MPLTATVPSDAAQIPSVAGEAVVRVDRSGAHELVSGVVSQHDVGQCADLGATVSLERRIEQLSVGIPGGCDECVASGGIGQVRTPRDAYR